MLQLTRFAETTGTGGRAIETLGRLALREDGEEVWTCKALELPDRDNKNNVSRIPAGTYVAEVVASSPSFDYPHVWIHDKGSVYAADDRAGAKIHIVNFARQLRGCVGVGREFVDLDGDGTLDVSSSEDTLEELVARMPDKTELRIENEDDPESIRGAPLDPLATLDADLRSLTALT